MGHHRPTKGIRLLEGAEDVNNDAEDLVAYLWGRDTRERYVVLDYEIPYPVDTPNLTAWYARLRAGQR